MRRGNKLASRDYGTPEIARRFRVVPKLTGPNSYAGKVIDDTEIDRLLAEDRIDSTEYSILEAFRMRLRKASYDSLRSPDFNASVRADPSLIGDRKARAVTTVIGIIGDMDKHEKIGREKRDGLINLVTEDRPWFLDMKALQLSVGALQGILSKHR